MKYKIFSAFILGTLLAGCSRPLLKPDPATAVSKPGVVKIWPSWVKDKGKKFDMNFQISSLDDKKMIIVFLTDIGCSRGGLTGQVKHTLFNSGERTIQLAPNQTKAFNMVCRLPDKASGEYSVTIAKVFDNPSGDGKNAGKVIAENIVWTHADK